MTHEPFDESRDVFLSAASQDASAANDICEALERQGVKCWVAPRDVMPGEHYADAIVHAMDATKVVVLVLSRSAATSPHVLREVERATSKRHPVISLRIDTAPLPEGLEYFLNTSQWLDASKGVATALPKLVDAVRHHRDRAGVIESRQEPVDPNGPAKSEPHTKWIIAGGVVVLLALAYVVGDKFWLSKPVSTEQPVAAVTSTVAPAATVISEKSIAVLPFTDMSEKHDQEYLADGMAEEILNLLAQVPDLLVPARTSSFYFKGKQTKIPDIARELGVVNVLEGSIRRSGDRLRVTAQLVRADTGYHLWSETYDRELRDVFKVQDDIANAVVQALQIKLMGGELSRRKGGTQNLEAYQLYLRALSAGDQNTTLSLDAAGDYLDQAIKLDPTYGMAWSLLAFNVTVKTDNRVLDGTEGYERVRQLAQHALQLSPDLAEAHGSLAWVLMTLDHDWAAAEAEVQRALAIDPTDPGALAGAGGLSRTLGRWEDAERQFRLALARDPLNTFVIWGLGTAYYGAGRFAEAEGMFRKLFELAPGFLWTRVYLGKTLLAEGKPEAALAVVQQEVDQGYRLALLPTALLAAGRQAEADEALKAQIAYWGDTDGYCVAASYARRGDHDRALRWLERAYEQKSSGLLEIISESLFRDDPHYQDFLRKMKLVE